MEDLCRKIVRWRVCKVLALVAFCSSSAARLYACLRSAQQSSAYAGTDRCAPFVCLLASHMLNTHLAAAVETWRTHAKQMRRGEGICARVLKHWTHRTAAAAFESWHLHAQEQRHMENVCSKIVSHMLNREVGCLGWFACVERVAYGNACLAHLHTCIFGASLQLAVGFETWRDHARRKARGEGIVARVLAHWLHRTAAGSRCFFFSFFMRLTIGAFDCVRCIYWFISICVL